MAEPAGQRPDRRRPKKDDTSIDNLALVGYSEDPEEGKSLLELMMSLGYEDLQSFQVGRNPEWFDDEDSRSLLLKFIRNQRKLFRL